MENSANTTQNYLLPLYNIKGNLQNITIQHMRSQPDKEMKSDIGLPYLRDANSPMISCKESHEAFMSLLIRLSKEFRETCKVQFLPQEVNSWSHLVGFY